MNTINRIFSKSNRFASPYLHLLQSMTLVLIGLFLSTSPVLVPPAHAQTQTNGAANLQSVLSLYSTVFNTGNFDIFNQVTTVDFVRHSPQGDFNREAYAASFSAQNASFSNKALTPLVVIADGDWVAVNSTYSGSFTKDLPVGGGKSIPATQKPFAFNVMVFYHFNSSGLLAEMWEEYDALNLDMQLGAIPAPKGVVIAMAPVPPNTLDPRSTVKSGTPAMRETLSKKLTLTVEEAFGQGIFDPDGIIASPDFVVHPTEENKEQFLQDILNLRDAMPDLKVTVNPVIVEGNWAAVSVTTTGTFTKGLKRADGSVVPPTNKVVTTTQNDMLRFDSNGLDAEQWTAQDNLELLIQLGVVSPNAAH